MCWIELSDIKRESLKNEATCRAVSIIKIGDIVYYEDIEPLEPIKVPKQMSLQRKYKNLCWRLTNLNAVLLPDIHLRAFKGGYHVDHIVPIVYGFKNNINPHYIASLDNLRMIPEKDNLSKGIKLTKEAIELLARWDIS